jgi:hypothetical protein
MIPLTDAYNVPSLKWADRRLLPLLEAVLTVRSVAGRLVVVAPQGAPEELRAEVRDRVDDFRALLDVDRVELGRRLLSVALDDLRQAGVYALDRVPPSARTADRDFDLADLVTDPAGWIAALSRWRSTWLKASKARP